MEGTENIAENVENFRMFFNIATAAIFESLDRCPRALHAIFSVILLLRNIFYFSNMVLELARSGEREVPHSSRRAIHGRLVVPLSPPFRSRDPGAILRSKLHVLC